MMEDPEHYDGATDKQTAYGGQEKPGSWRARVLSGWSLFWAAVFLALVTELAGGLSF